MRRVPDDDSEQAPPGSEGGDGSNGHGAMDGAGGGGGGGNDGPPLPPPGPSREPVLLSVPRSSVGVLSIGAILAMLYLGRPVLVPVTLAVVLSFAIAPVIRALRHLGLGHVMSVLAAVSALGIALLALATVIGVQTVQMASNASQYEATVKAKVQVLRGETVARMEPLWTAAERITDSLGLQDMDDERSRPAVAPGKPQQNAAIPVEIREPPPTAAVIVQRLVSAVIGPIGMAGIVIIVLIFVLLEQEALRDRFIRLAGGADLRAATTAINDAGERLSRFFLRQFAVNFSVGVVLWALLAAIGLPHAILWGSLTAVLRFVPYLGVPLATLLASFLAFAVDPGWTLLILTLGVFVLVQTMVSQIIEPRLYGHATGLSPLSIVLATLFWGWLWGPIGVIMSTPLTLCLAVAGRHVHSLGFLDIVLGDGPALTMPQKFYQRALSGDADEIIETARQFLKRKPFATYCDTVLMPALALGRVDLNSGAITARQQAELRRSVIRVIEALGSDTRKGPYKRPPKTLLEDQSPGRELRAYRLRRQQGDAAGRGDLDFSGTTGSIVLCVGLPALGDDLATELLVRILRDLHIDARHLSLEELRSARPANVSHSDVAAVCIVSVEPRLEQEAICRIAAGVRNSLPQTFILALLLRGMLEPDESMALSRHIDRQANSLEDATLEVAEHLAIDSPAPAGAPALRQG